MRVFIVDGEMKPMSGASLRLVRLPVSWVWGKSFSATSREERYFALHRPSAGSKPRLLEVQRANCPTPSSWFVNNNILSGGELFLCTKADPLLVMLPVRRAPSHPPSLRRDAPSSDQHPRARRWALRSAFRGGAGLECCVPRSVL